MRADLMTLFSDGAVRLKAPGGTERTGDLLELPAGMKMGLDPPLALALALPAALAPVSPRTRTCARALSPAEPSALLALRLPLSQRTPASPSQSW